MEFDINKLAEEFKQAVNWMLIDKYAEKIKGDLDTFKKQKNSLETNPDSPDALRMIIELIITNGRRLKKPKDFDSKMDSFISKYEDNFRITEAKNELIGMVGEKKKKNIEQLLKPSTIKEFTEKLYNLAKQGKTEVLGEKGRDNYLRDFGYWDRIPIDRHEMRLIIRTGIYHACSKKDKSDHLEKSHLHDALTRFCTKYLKGYVVEEIDLGDAPGIVDIFIWSFSADDTYMICGSTPKCKECCLKNVCLYAMTNLNFCKNP